MIETKRPAVVGSLRDPRLTPAVHEINRDYELKSWATLPLIVKDRVIGTVELVESGAERTFTQAELDTAAAICHAAALAIENARCSRASSRRRARRSCSTTSRARTAASLDLEEVVKAAVDELRQLMSFESTACCCSRARRVARVIASRAAGGGAARRSPRRLRPGFVERIAAEGVLVVRLPEDLPRPGRITRPSRASRSRRHHRAAVRHRPARRPRPEQRRARTPSPTSTATCSSASARSSPWRSRTPSCTTRSSRCTSATSRRSARRSTPRTTTRWATPPASPPTR